jgi:geranylgeranyl pyrophosphate synthase
MARALLDEVIAVSTEDTAFAVTLSLLLAGPGRVLEHGRSGKWLTYVVETARVFGGEPATAVQVAAAIACVIAAADVVDDLADDEWDGRDGTPPQAINASVALYALAQRCIAELGPRIGAARALQIADCTARGYLLAAAGEEADLRLEADPEATAEGAHAMTARKAGALVALACVAGALVATDDPAILDRVHQFGMHAGIVAQLRNDIAGIAPDAHERGSDLRRRKKTLPVAYALRCAREEGIPRLLAWYDRLPGPRDAEARAEEDAIARLIDELGGARYAALVADVHRREARAVLRSLMRLTRQSAVGDLRHLVPPVWQVPSSTDGRC